MKQYDFKAKDRKTGELRNCGYMRYNAAEGESTRAELYFYGDICSESLGRWKEYFPDSKAPQDIADFFAELEDKTQPLDVYINSGGGSVFGGIAIYNILRRYQGEKTAHIDGLAASIAGIIPFACDKVKAPKSAQIMLHKPWSYCQGNADDMKKCIESLDVCEKSIIDIYSEHTVNGTTAEDIKAMIGRETWLTCEEASKYFDIEIENGEYAASCESEYFAQYKNIPDRLKEPPSDGTAERKRRLQLELDALGCGK